MGAGFMILQGVAYPLCPAGHLPLKGEIGKGRTPCPWNG